MRADGKRPKVPLDDEAMVVDEEEEEEEEEEHEMEEDAYDETSDIEEVVSASKDSVVTRYFLFLSIIQWSLITYIALAVAPSTFAKNSRLSQYFINLILLFVYLII